MHISWDVYFRNVDAGLPPGAAFTPPPSLQPGFRPTAVAAPAAAAGSGGGATRDAIALVHLIRAYQVRGHEVATLDPLGQRNRAMSSLSELSPTNYGFTEADLDRTFDVSGVSGVAGFLGPSVLAANGTVTLRALLAKLQGTYCGATGWEYMHINSRDKCNWLRERIELATLPPMPRAAKLQLFDRLAYADHFERYLANKFNTAKRFGLEGAETLIPGLKAMVDKVTQLGVESISMGMPHRGRLK